MKKLNIYYSFHISSFNTLTKEQRISQSQTECSWLCNQSSQDKSRQPIESEGKVLAQ